MVSFDEAQKNLPYFQACLKEAMRLQPAVGLNITRKVPPGGAEIDGVRVPEGTSVAVNGWVLHRDEAVWGKDADIYRPERWLDVDKERLREMDRSMFQVSRLPFLTFLPPQKSQPHRSLTRNCMYSSEAAPTSV
jgi:cytochrome P450